MLKILSFALRFFKMKADKKVKREDDELSEGESVDDEEFDEFLSKHEAGFDGPDDFEMDFAGYVTIQSDHIKSF